MNHSFSLLAFATGALLLSTVSSSHAVVNTSTVTVTSGPTFSGGLTSNTIGVSNPTGNLIKLSGDALFTQAASAFPSISITLGGTFTLYRGDAFTLAYSFSVDLPVATTYSLGGNVSVNAGFFNIPLRLPDQSGTLTSGQNDKTGTASNTPNDGIFDAFGSPLRGTFDLSFIIDVSGLTTGQTVNLSIPPHSIDLAVGPIPEPPTYVLLGLGLVGTICATRRRKAS